MKARSLFALALAALLVPAAVSAAPAKAAPASPMQGLSIGGTIGYETDDLGGIALRADAELPFKALSPQVNLSWVGSLGYSRLTDSVGEIDTTANVIKIIPSARFTFPVTPQFSVFGDAGLGLYYASLSVDEITIPGLGTVGGGDDSEFSLMMRIGGGVWYQLNETTRVGGLLEFDPYFGDFDQTTFIFQAGAMFRM
jgi:hypothetical protein